PGDADGMFTPSGRIPCILANQRSGASRLPSLSIFSPADPRRFSNQDGLPDLEDIFMPAKSLGISMESPTTFSTRLPTFFAKSKARWVRVLLASDPGGPAG